MSLNCRDLTEQHSRMQLLLHRGSRPDFELCPANNQQIYQQHAKQYRKHGFMTCQSCAQREAVAEDVFKHQHLFCCLTPPDDSIPIISRKLHLRAGAARFAKEDYIRAGVNQQCTLGLMDNPG
jgi:hypothetical protein